MPRIARKAPPGLVYHVLNRTVGKMHMLRKEADFLAFERVMLHAHKQFPLRILSYCLMSNHWHFVVWPERNGELTGFFRVLAHTHAVRWRHSHNTVGYGHLYQDRFKSFPIQTDDHLLTVCRYVERNALNANLVRSAADWRWSSLHARAHGPDEIKALLSPWPVPIPRNWANLVDTPMTPKEIERLQTSLRRGRPFGSNAWLARTAADLDLQHTIRPEGRPRKLPEDEN